MGFYEDLEQSLLEAIAIEKGGLPLEEKENMVATTYIVANIENKLIDEIIELFCADKTHDTSRKGVKATGYRKGYTRSLLIDGYTFTLNYDRDMWRNPACVETPFWIAIRDHEWDQNEKMLKKFDLFPENKKQIYWNMVYLALEPLQNATFSEVCEDIKCQIERYIEIITSKGARKNGISKRSCT